MPRLTRSRPSCDSTAFTNDAAGFELVTDRGKIAQRYLSGWFWIDAPSSVPVELIEFFVHDPEKTSTLRILRILRMFRLVRLLRLLKLEAMTRGGHGDRLYAVSGGVEHTRYQVFGSAGDLGLLTEGMYDSRGSGAPPTLFEHDVFVGVR